MGSPRPHAIPMDNPYFELDPNALAQACDARAGELHARAWHSEEERNALREATAELLAAVARQLSGVVGSRDAGATDLSAGDLREIIATRVRHAPLHAPAAHAWVNDFTPGDGTPTDAGG